MNPELPFMPDSGEIEAAEIDLLLDDPETQFELFSVVKRPVSLADHAICLHVPRLIHDGGTLQIGIGAIGDAIAAALIASHESPEVTARMLAECPFPQAVAPSEEGPFSDGLYVVTEMLVDGIQHLIDAGIVKREVDGAAIHAGYFVECRDFYARLRQMPPRERARIAMMPVSLTNRFYGDEAGKRAARRHAGFVNSAMTVTALGRVVSDSTRAGETVCGVGGQFKFVEQALALREGRSVITLNVTCESRGKVRSNIIREHPHEAVPRHLRDIVVTEYGVADLRGASDEHAVVLAMISIADSRFQERLLKRAKAAGKVVPSALVPVEALQNTPRRLRGWLRPGATRASAALSLRDRFHRNRAGASAGAGGVEERARRAGRPDTAGAARAGNAPRCDGDRMSRATRPRQRADIAGTGAGMGRSGKARPGARGVIAPDDRGRPLGSGNGIGQGDRVRSRLLVEPVGDFDREPVDEGMIIVVLVRLDHDRPFGRHGLFGHGIDLQRIAVGGGAVGRGVFLVHVVLWRLEERDGAVELVELAVRGQHRISVEHDPGDRHDETVVLGQVGHVDPLRERRAEVLLDVAPVFQRVAVLERGQVGLDLDAAHLDHIGPGRGRAEDSKAANCRCREKFHGFHPFGLQSGQFPPGLARQRSGLSAVPRPPRRRPDSGITFSLRNAPPARRRNKCAGGALRPHEPKEAPMKTFLIVIASLALLAGCETRGESTLAGAATGAALGAAVSDDAGKGALIGGVAGGVAGNLIGRAREKNQCVYENAYGRRYVAPCS